MTPIIAVLACYDFLVSGHGIETRKDQWLKLCFNKNAARLKSAFTRLRVQARQPTIQRWKCAVNEGWNSRKLVTHGPGEGQVHFEHPRWIRVNFLKTSLEWECQHGALQGFQEIQDVQQLLHKHRANDKVFARDSHVADLVVIPPAHNLTDHQSYKDGQIILQDKASCFPAALLSPKPEEGSLLDACAAPGNKTSHMAAVLQRNRLKSDVSQWPMQQIYALDSCMHRAETLKKMIRKHVDGRVEVRCIHNDFLKFVVGHEKSDEIGSILLDPSCSGSGIIGREGDYATERHLNLPRPPTSFKSHGAHQAKTLKRKRPKSTQHERVEDTERGHQDCTDDRKLTPKTIDPDCITASPSERIKNLAEMQVQLLLKALRFSSVHKVVYSTCSVHAEENEFVILRALYDHGLTDQGWVIQPRNEQVPGMREWNRRGDLEAIRQWCGRVGGQKGKPDEAVNENGYHDKKDAFKSFDDEMAQSFAESCLRCEKWTDEGTQGFFAMMLVKRTSSLGPWPHVDGPQDDGVEVLPRGNWQHTLAEGEIESDGEQWEGFSDQNLADEEMNGDVF